MSSLSSALFCIASSNLPTICRISMCVVRNKNPFRAYLQANPITQDQLPQKIQHALEQKPPCVIAPILLLVVLSFPLVPVHAPSFSSYNSIDGKTNYSSQRSTYSACKVLISPTNGIRFVHLVRKRVHTFLFRVCLGDPPTYHHIFSHLLKYDKHS